MVGSELLQMVSELAFDPRTYKLSEPFVKIVMSHIG